MASFTRPPARFEPRNGEIIDKKKIVNGRHIYTIYSLRRQQSIVQEKYSIVEWILTGARISLCFLHSNSLFTLSLFLCISFIRSFSFLFLPFSSFFFLFLPFPSFSFLFLPFPSFFLCFCSILLVGWSKLQKFFACGRPLYSFTLLSENSKIFFSLRSKPATAPFINTQKSIFIQ